MGEYSYAVTAIHWQQMEAKYAMSRAYGKKQRISNQRPDRRGPGRSRERIAGKSHRNQLAVVRTLTRVAPFPIGKCIQGNVVLANVPYTDGTGSKTRPVVVVRRVDSHALLVYRCTTQGRDARTSSLLAITDLEACGLSRRTWIDPTLIEIERRDIIQSEGRLSDEDEARLFGSAVGEFGNGSQRVPA
jgi:hypothetical protein